jgi:hypothetical protein
MTKDEAMRLALEALEYIDLCDNDRDFLHPHECFQLDEAITAIKQALAAPVQEPVAIVSGYYGGQCVILPVNPSRIFNSGTAFYTSPPAAQPAPVQEPVIDHSCKDTYELIMKWADIYAAQTGNLYAQAAQDPSKVARMADERTMLACVVAQAISQPPEPDLLSALKRILDEPNNTMSDGKALKEIIRIARAAIAKATGEQA